MIYILIPAHNNCEDVLALHECLMRQSYADFRIILVDDGSTDGTEEAIEKKYPDTVILKGDGTLWWTGANVLGVKYILQHAGPEDFVLLLNNDLVVKEDYLSQLLHVSVKLNRAIVGSTVTDQDNPSHFEGAVRLNHRCECSVEENQDFIRNNEFDCHVDVLAGRGSLVPIEVFHKIGTFNARKLPHYGADYEFFVRANRAGYKLVMSHRAIVYANLKQTGMVIPEKNILSFSECYQLLFSKRSKVNPLYRTRYAWLCSEKPYRLRNSVRCFLTLLRHTLGKTVACIGFFWVVRLFYRIFIKSYPFRGKDILKFGLDPQKMLEDRTLREVIFPYPEKKYYYFTAKLRFVIKLYSGQEAEAVRALVFYSYSYWHRLIFFSSGKQFFKWIFKT